MSLDLILLVIVIDAILQLEAAPFPLDMLDSCL
jgi:hypothetical protein